MHLTCQYQGTYSVHTLLQLRSSEQAESTVVKLFATSRSKIDKLIKNGNHANIVVMQVQELVGCLKGAVDCNHAVGVMS